MTFIFCTNRRTETIIFEPILKKENYLLFWRRDACVCCLLIKYLTIETLPLTLLPLFLRSAMRRGGERDSAGDRVLLLELLVLLLFANRLEVVSTACKRAASSGTIHSRCSNISPAQQWRPPPQSCVLCPQRGVELRLISWR
jgi:hypothetical protein